MVMKTRLMTRLQAETTHPLLACRTDTTTAANPTPPQPPGLLATPTATAPTMPARRSPAPPRPQHGKPHAKPRPWPDCHPDSLGPRPAAHKPRQHDAQEPATSNQLRHHRDTASPTSPLCHPRLPTAPTPPLPHHAHTLFVSMDNSATLPLPCPCTPPPPPAAPILPPRNRYNPNVVAAAPASSPPQLPSPQPPHSAGLPRTSPIMSPPH
ncbi:hypothetical protein EDB84DRAFT_1558916 [Lactarius hengduanensis]|nr:hypothetical protein EDB84DRAFT_1558916 [Lactarius hengduanensis]